MRLRNIVIINALFPSIWLIYKNLPIVVYVSSIATWGNASSWMKCGTWAQRAGICASTLLVSCYVLDNWRKVKIWRQKNKTELSVRDRRQDTRQCLETQKSGLYCKTDAAKWKWDWTQVAYVRLHKADEIQGRSERGGGAGETWAEAETERIYRQIIKRQQSIWKAWIPGRILWWIPHQVWFTLRCVFQLVYFHSWPGRTTWT